MIHCPPYGRKEREAGFTIIEVLLATALVALVVGSAVGAFRSMAKSDLRASASRMAGVIRYLFDRASTTGRVHRLVLDLDTGKYWAETTDDRFRMAPGRETEKSREKLAGDIAKEEEEARKRAERATNRPDLPERYRPEEWRPKRAKFGAFKETAVRPGQIKGATITDLFTPRLAEPLTAGQGYIYFFPLGMSEAAIVHLADKKKETFYSLIVHPLTGRVQIKNWYVEPPIERQFDDSGKEIVQ